MLTSFTSRLCILVGNPPDSRVCRYIAWIIFIPTPVMQGFEEKGVTMAKSKLRDLPDLSALATPGRVFSVKVTPKAARDRVICEKDQIKMFVTAPPQNGKANHAVLSLLAKCLGVAPSTLTLKQGQTARNKVFLYDP